MKFDDEPRLWGTVDPDYVAFHSEDQCPFEFCNLLPDHEGPHLDAHYLSGRIFGLWPNTGSVITAEDISDEAVKIAEALNEARDEATEAIEKVLHLRTEMELKYADSTDEHVKLLLKSGLWPISEYDIDHCGTEASGDEYIREELLDMLGLNREEL